MSKTIEEKVLSKYYKYIPCQRKTFELQKDEDNVQVGDILWLKEWDGEKFTGRSVKREVTYILRGVPEYGLTEGFCIIGMQPRGWNDHTVPQMLVNCKQYGDNNVAIANLGTLNIDY